VVVVDIVPVPGDSFEQTLAWAGPDVLREMIRAFAQKMMDAEVEVACGAGYEVSPARVKLAQRLPGPGVGHPRGHRRAGDPEAAARQLLPVVPGAPPPCRAGPGHRHRHLLPGGVSTRRVEKLAEAMGVTGLS
jgi:hypothetical protein